MPLSLLVDPDATMNIETVSRLPADRFTPSPRGFAAGFTPKTFWLRVDLPAAMRDGAERWLVLGPPFIDSVDVFELTSNGWKRHAGGDLQAVATRDISYRDFVFRLQPQGDASLFIRVASTSTVMLFGALWEPAGFATQALPEARNWGLYFGALALIIVLLAGFALVFRQWRFVVLFLTCLFNYGMVAGLQGFHTWLLWPESPLFASMSLGMLVCLGSGMAIFLIRECLDSARHFPRLDTFYQLVGSLLILASLSVPLGVYQWVAGWVTILTELSTLLGVLLALRLARLGRRIQWAFALAFAVHFLAVAPVLAINFGLVPPSKLLHTLWQYELIPHVLVIAILFLIEIRHAHVRWVSEQNEALMATKEARDLLESRVAERTQDLAKARGELQEALDSEREALFEQRKFMAMVSHEFRTPLAVIDAAATNLIDVPPSDEPDLESRAKQILRASGRLVSLTDTCLADSRLNDRAFKLQCEAVPLLPLIEGAAEVAGAAARQRVEIVLSENLPLSITADSGLLRIALSNLIDNALKYAPEGKIVVNVINQQRALRIQVRDTGAGIPEEERSLIFERYQRGISAPKGKGAGLGLPVSRQIALAHGGELRLLASSTSGSTFELELPQSPQETAQ